MSHDYTDILIELNKAVKALKFYPEGHPKRGNVVGDLYKIIKQTADETGGIDLKANNKGIFSDGTPIAPSSPAIRLLTRLLFVRKVQALSITPEIKPEDVLTLLKTLNLEPEDIYSMGGVEKILAREGVEGILLNEITYEELQELKREVEEEEEGQEEEEEEEEGEPAEEEPLSTLLQLIDGERDMLKYNDLAVRIKERTDLLVSQKRFDEALPVLALFLSHTRPEHVGLEGLRETARDCLRRYLIKDVLSFLITLLAKEDAAGVSADDIRGIITAAGEEAVGPLLDAVVATNDAGQRRAVFDTLAGMGEMIRPGVEERLNQGDWFAVRQMAALLGALGGAESLATLERIYCENPDPKIRKEMLKSLAVIPSEQSTRILISALEEEDEGIVGQAMMSLGILGITSVIDSLGAMISRKGRFYENFEMKKVVITALGYMKDEQALPYLTSTLFKKTWFGKDANEELRVQAVNSLAKIGTDPAYEAIDRVFRDSSGLLYTTCKRILEARGK